MFSSPQSPDRVRGPPSPPIQWIQKGHSQGRSGLIVNFTTYLHAVPKSTMAVPAAALPQLYELYARCAEFIKDANNLTFTSIIFTF
jgi:hypothetical protein